MRLPLLLLLVISFSFAQNITYFLNISGQLICPGDILVMTAEASNGQPAPGVELRLVLHYPYQGLRALQTTDSSGQASTKLTKPGEYRIYINTDEYNHPQYVSFNQSELCPPLPPESFNLTVIPDCNSSLLIISAYQDSTPLEDVFIRTLNWSSFSSPSGSVAFPLEEGYVFIQANKSGYVSQEFWTNVSCRPPEPPKPPPECLEDSSCADNQYCMNETCMNLTGECGYTLNHSWVDYECCEDVECGYKMICDNNSCILEPPPPPNASEENATSDDIGTQEAPAIMDSDLIIYLIAGSLIVILAAGAYLGLRKGET